MKYLAIIPARGGSKGVPKKNIRNFRGKPLISWTINAAKASTLIDDVILSSDDPEIIAIAKEYGCGVPFIREAAISQDKTPSIDVVFDAIKRYPSFDWVVLLQPTSPLRTSFHIDEAITLCKNKGATSCASVTKVSQNPYWMYSLDKNQEIQPLIKGKLPSRRQDLPSIYRLNGAIYICNVDWLNRNKNFVGSKTLGYVMNNSDSLDIDREEDFNS